MQIPAVNLQQNESDSALSASLSEASSAASDLPKQPNLSGVQKGVSSKESSQPSGGTNNKVPNHQRQPSPCYKKSGIPTAQPIPQRANDNPPPPSARSETLPGSHWATPRLGRQEANLADEKCYQATHIPVFNHSTPTREDMQNSLVLADRQWEKTCRKIASLTKVHVDKFTTECFSAHFREIVTFFSLSCYLRQCKI
jgi:hypothetical protein